MDRPASTRCARAASTSTPASRTWTGPASGPRCASPRSSRGSAAPSTRGPQDTDLGLACLRAFNDWHLEVWAGTHPERIIPLQLPWLADVGGGGGRGAGQRGARLQGGQLPRVPRPAAAALHLQRRLGPLLRRLRGDRHRRLPAHRRVRLGAAPLARPAVRAAAHLLPRQRAAGGGRMAVVGRPAALPRPEGGHVRGRHRLGAHADGPGRLRARALGLGHREPRLALRPAAERGAAAQLLVLLHRRSLRGGAAPRDRRRPHHGGERLPPRRLVVARHPARPRRDLGHAPRRRAAGRGRRQRRPAVPPSAPAGRRLAHARDRERPRRRGAAPLPPRAGPGGRRRRPRRRARWPPGRRCPRPHRPRITRRPLAATSTSWSATPRSWPCRSGTLARPGSTFDDPATFRPLADAQPGGSDPVARLRRHGHRGHRPGRAVPDHRAVLLRRRGPGGGRRPGRRLQRLAGRLLRRRPAPALRGGHAPAAGSRRPPRTSCGAPSTELGFVAGFVRPNPCLGRSLSDRAYDAAVGRGRGARRADRDPRGQLGHRADARVGPPLQPARSSTRCRTPFEEMLACAAAHRLRGARAPPGAARASSSSPPAAGRPFWLERLDEQAESFGGFCPDMALRPSEYFARQCAISFEVDERTLPALAPFVGDDAHRVGQRLPAPRRHVPRRRGRHPGHRRPLPHRDAGPGARAQRAAGSTGSPRAARGSPA